MHLTPNTLLAGKYIILQSLIDSDIYIMYLAKAPSMAEEFVLTEFFPRDLASRDEGGYITVSPDDAEVLDTKLDAYTNDCRKLMSMSANRFWGVKEVLSELGTTFVVSKKLEGDLLYTFLEGMGEDNSFNENMIENVYDSMRSISSQKIPLHVGGDMIYVENIGSITFMFDYKPGYTESEIVLSTAKILYSLMTKKVYEDVYNPELIPEEHKFKGVITGALGNNRTVHSFSDADNEIEYSLRKYAKEADFKEYKRGLIFVIIVILAIGVGVAYGIHYLAEMFLG